MRLLLARILMRIRGPINVQAYGENVLIEGEPVLVRCHRRFVTVWALWYASTWVTVETDGEPEARKAPYVSLHIYRIPWRRIDTLYQKVGGPEDE